MVARAGSGPVTRTRGERLEGILTERDLMRAVASRYTEKARVSEWMTRHPGNDRYD